MKVLPPVLLKVRAGTVLEVIVENRVFQAIRPRLSHLLSASSNHVHHSALPTMRSVQVQPGESGQTD